MHDKENRTVVQTMNSFVKLLKIIILSESCPKNCVGKIVQQFTSEGPMNCFGELPNKFTSEDCPTYYIGGLPIIKNKYFCFENDFHTWLRHV